MLRRALPALAVLSLAVAGCGGSGDGEKPRTAARPAAFPKAGTTYQQVRGRFGAKLALAPGAGVPAPRHDPHPVPAARRAGRPLDGARIALYTMAQDGSGVEGPFTAREQPFEIKPAFVSRTTASDPDQRKTFYVADVTTRRRAPVAMFAVAQVGGRTLATSPQSVGIKEQGPQPPDVGDRAIAMHTLTPGDVGGDYTKLTTRVPPAKDLVQTDLADVLGKKPVVLIFATPALCQSRVCGPDVDVAEQVKSETGDAFAWVHQEIYRDNEVNKGLRPQVARWHLQTEPWLYVIGRDRRIKARLEGAVSVPELRALVERYKDA